MVLYTTKFSVFIIISAIETTQPQQWVTDVSRMYYHWAEKHDYKVDVLEESTDDHRSGLSYVTLELTGDGVYGALQHETGIHRCQRINSDMSTKVQITHFAAVEVIPVMSNHLLIQKQYLDITRGWSWRHVKSKYNRFDTGVQVIHKPTKLEAFCNGAFKAKINQENALRILKSKLNMIMHLKGVTLDEILSTDVAPKLKTVREYIFYPKEVVKDWRTKIKTNAIKDVLNGNIDLFI